MVAGYNFDLCDAVCAECGLFYLIYITLCWLHTYIHFSSIINVEYVVLKPWILQVVWINTKKKLIKKKKKRKTLQVYVLLVMDMLR